MYCGGAYSVLYTGRRCVVRRHHRFRDQDVASGQDKRIFLIRVHDKGQCVGAPSKGVKGMKKGFLL
eukprot:COSAG02_NODE_3692_length_6376_cov_17.973395_3_plen_66_part_00